MGASHPRNKSKRILEGDHQVQKAQRLESSWAVFLTLQGVQNPLEILLKHRSPRHSESAGRGWGSQTCCPCWSRAFYSAHPAPPHFQCSLREALHFCTATGAIYKHRFHCSEQRGCAVSPGFQTHTHFRCQHQAVVFPDFPLLEPPHGLSRNERVCSFQWLWALQLLCLGPRCPLALVYRGSTFCLWFLGRLRSTPGPSTMSTSPPITRFLHSAWCSPMASERASGQDSSVAKRSGSGTAAPSPNPHLPLVHATCSNFSMSLSFNFLNQKVGTADSMR